MSDTPKPEQHEAELREELAELRARLEETQQELHAIRHGEVDAITIASPSGDQVYSLRGAELPYREMIEAMSEGALNLAPNGLVLYCNQRLADMARTDLRTIIGCHLQSLFTDRDGATITQALHDSRSRSARVRAQLRTSDGGTVPVNVTMHVQADGAIHSVVTIVTDLTEVVAAQEVLANSHKRLEQANRALHTLNVCSTAIIHATDEKRSLADICHILVDVGGYMLAWVGYVEHDEAKSVRPVAQSDGDGGYVNSARISWGNDERGNGPAGRAIRTGKIAVVRDISADATFKPWREMAQRSGLNSAAAAPLQSGDEIFGVLMVYSGRPAAFDVPECEFLTELADDIAYCVTNIRREVKLAETRAFLDNLLQSSTKYSIISADLDRRILYWNEGARRNYGYTADEAVGRSLDMLYAPEARASGAVAPMLESVINHGMATVEIERLRKDGTRFPASVVVTRRDDAAGNLIGYLVISNDITEKRQAEKDLQARETALQIETNKLRSILDSMAEAVVVADKDGNIIASNPAAHSMSLLHDLDTTVSGWVDHAGLLLADCVTPLAEEQNPLVRALRGENTNAIEICLQHTDGPTAYVQATGRPILGADGAVSGGLVVLTDVTERKQAATERQESANIFRTLTDAMPQLVWMCTPDGLNIYFNQQWVDYTGLPLEAGHGRGWDTPFHPDDQRPARDAWNHSMETGETYRVEIRLRAADGSYRWFLVKGQPLRDAEGHITKWIGTGTDIDELKRAEAKLFVSSQYARSLLEASLDPLVAISPDGKITDLNHGTELVTGERRERLIGTDFATYFTEPERARTAYRQVFTKGFITDYPLAIRHVSGTVTEVLYNASLYRDPNGEVAGVFAAARDISRLPVSNASSGSGSRPSLWRYAVYATAAIAVFIGVSAASVTLNNWLQDQQDKSELMRSFATNSRLRDLLSEIVPTPARVRVGIFHTRPGTNAMFGYSISYAVAAPNHRIGIVNREVPLEMLSNELATLTSGICVHRAQQTYDDTLHLADEVICPITSGAHQMRGFLSVSWDHDDPAPASFDAVTAATAKAAADLVRIWADYAQ